MGFLSRLICLSVPCCLASVALAAEFGLHDPAPGGNGQTFLQLLQPAIGTVSEAGGTPIFKPNPGLRDIELDGAEPEPPEEFQLSGVQAEVLPGGSGTFVVLADSGEFYAILAAFDPERKDPLADAAVVASDRSSYLGPVLDLSGGASFIDVRSQHLNTGQAYAVDTLMLFDGERLTLIDTLLTLSDAGCGYTRDQKPKFEAKPAATGIRADIEASITEIVETTGEDCETTVDTPAPSERRISVTYNWDAVAERYVASSDALKVLEEETSERF